MRLAKWLIFFGAVAALDALRDAGYGHEHWLRQEFLWSDYWHICVKQPALYGPLVVVLNYVWPIYRPRDRGDVWLRTWHWHNIPRWLAAAAVGWIAWEVAVRAGGAPWLE